MFALLKRLLAVAVPVIAILVAAAFVLSPDLSWCARQVVLAAIGIGGVALGEVLLFRTPLSDLANRLGFKRPNQRSVLICLAGSLPMWLFLPAAAIASGMPVRVEPNWLAIVVGVVLVNGLAEEVIHRAFFFGRLRELLRFGAAATLGAVLFGAQHLYLIETIGLAGVASAILAVLLAYPLCFAFELGGRSIVGPAILHTSSNAAFLVFGHASDSGLLMFHMLVVLASIYAIFFSHQPVICPSDRASIPFDATP